MVLIFSTETDVSTSDVIEWLQYLDIPCVRLNVEEKIDV